MLIRSLCFLSPVSLGKGLSLWVLEGLELWSATSVVTCHHHWVSPKFWRRIGSATLEG